jgi:hypothetical protein
VVGFVGVRLCNADVTNKQGVWPWLKIDIKNLLFWLNSIVIDNLN